MVFYGLENLTENQRKLLSQTLKFFDKIGDSKVAMIFDNIKYENEYPDYDCLGFHLNVSTGLPFKNPKYIEELIENDKISNILFFSYQTLELDGIQFVWVLAHELRHLEQNLISNDISLIGSLLYNNLGYLFPGADLCYSNIPDEYDSELKAFKVVECIFGTKNAIGYIDNMCEKGRKSFELLKLGYEQEFDVVAELIVFLKMLRDEYNIKSLENATSYNITELIQRLEKIKCK